MLINQTWRAECLMHMPKDNFNPVIEAKMTPGMGDLMHLMNVAHLRSFYLQKEVNLVLNWFHDKDYLYHFEDPETIVERFEYINNFYSKELTNVNIEHVFNSNNSELHHIRYTNYNRAYKLANFEKRSRFRYNDWFFRPLNFETVKNKVVLWTQVNNAQQPRMFKRPFDRDEWNKVIDIIELQGYDVVQIDYRTPISEVMYHIGTAEVCLCYEGMWHYVARNMAKPIIVLTKDRITNYHTPDALIYSVKKTENHSLRYFYDFNRRVYKAQLFAKLQKQRLEGMFKREN